MKILLLAGEQSGVFYAERLKAALTEVWAAKGRTGEIAFRGYGDWGFRIADLAVMGILPVIRRIFYFLGVARTMKRAILTWKPDVVVTVDYPGLNLKLAAFAKARGIPAVHLVCPQVWAWHRGRIPKIARALTKLLCFFPFEPALFKAVARPDFEARFIGHPLVDITAEEDRAAASDENALPWPSGLPRVALLPGSRKGEIARILPRQLEALQRVSARLGAVGCLIPAAHARARRQIEKVLRAGSYPPVTVVDGRARDILRTAGVAAVASGTATLEAALAHVPTVLCYATTPTFAWFLRYFVTGVRFAGLVNIIAERCAAGDGEPPRRRPGEGPGKGGPMPELLQEELTAENLADLLVAWLSDPAARSQAVRRVDEVLGRIRSDGHALANAAREILARVPAASAG